MKLFKAVTNFPILEIFSLVQTEEKLPVWDENAANLAYFCFQEKNAMIKIAKNCEHNIDPPPPIPREWTFADVVSNLRCVHDCAVRKCQT
jgi:hypothetical protein